MLVIIDVEPFIFKQYCIDVVQEWDYIVSILLLSDDIL